MFRSYHGTSANDVWRQIAHDFSQANHVATTQSRGGRVVDLGNVCLSISNPRERWIACREPAINPAFAIAEVIWIVNGRNDAQFVTYFNRQLPRFAGNHTHYPGAYGYRLRSSLGVDQLERAYLALGSASISRQVVLQIWDGRIDLPAPDGTPSTTDVPCNIVSILKVREEKLNWTQVLRSNDFLLGLPHNIIQFTTLQEVIAGWLGIECGDFNLVTDSLHLYERDAGHIKELRSITAASNSDNISVAKDESALSFRTLAESVDLIVNASVPADDIYRMAMHSQLSDGFRNMLFIVAAEGLRRRKDLSRSAEVMQSCNNAAYCQAWSRWISRMEATSCSTS